MERTPIALGAVSARGAWPLRALGAAAAVRALALSAAARGPFRAGRRATTSGTRCRRRSTRFSEAIFCLLYTSPSPRD
eukprot:7840388-Alexandrium_andersonii.AAC.1